MQATFERVWDDFQHLPNSVLFKAMGFSPGFLVKMGLFRTIGNLPEICSNKFQNSYNSILNHISVFLKATAMKHLGIAHSTILDIGMKTQGCSLTNKGAAY